MIGSENPCPCCSGKKYEECCQPFHKGALPKNALELMRSRYSAYALNIPEYLIATTHPASPQFSDNKFSWKRSLSQFSRYSTFHRLEVLDFQERDTLASVTFTAYISEGLEDSTFTERSYFEKIGPSWLYRVGELEEGREPSLVLPGPLRILPLAYYGDPILRRKADPVIEITDEIKKLVEEMIETMDAFDGMGLAAPQVHQSIRLFITRIPIENEDDTYEKGEVKVFINPKLSEPSDETWNVEEGCLSIPLVRAAFDRPTEIICEYTSLDGTVTKARFSDWEARAIMHENDHLNGVLSIDRLESKKRSKLDPFLRSLEKRIQVMRTL